MVNDWIGELPAYVVLEPRRFGRRWHRSDSMARSLRKEGCGYGFAPFKLLVLEHLSKILYQLNEIYQIYEIG